MAAWSLHDSLKAVAVAANQSLAVLPPPTLSSGLFPTLSPHSLHVDMCRGSGNTTVARHCVAFPTDLAKTAQTGQLKPKQSGVSGLPARLVIKTVNQSVGSAAAAAAAAINRTHAYILYIYIFFFMIFMLLSPLWPRPIFNFENSVLLLRKLCTLCTLKRCFKAARMTQVNYRLSCRAITQRCITLKRSFFHKHKDICRAQSLPTAERYYHSS